MIRLRATVLPRREARICSVSPRVPFRVPFRVPLLGLMASAGLCAGVFAQDGLSLVTPGVDRAVIAEALAAVTDDVRAYNDHLTILASPWMEGRLPGTRGMELAKEYMEFQFVKSGLVAPLPKEVENEDGTISVESNASFRQPFNLGATNVVLSVSMELGDGTSFEHGMDKEFTVTGLGTGGDVTAEAVFVGYAIDGGPNEFTSFARDVDLEGKVAVLLRFEPMDEDGVSLWNGGRQGWTRRAGFTPKLKAVADRGAVAAIIINTPGASDRRINSLLAPGGTGRGIVAFPVLHMTQDAGETLIEHALGDGRTLESLREDADLEPLAIELDGPFTIRAEIERRAVVAENVIGLLPGKGRLADQYIVVGAHLDHLGQGAFGSLDRDGGAGRLLHPGADDNASGSAGIILIADKMAKVYAAAHDEAHLRSVLFIGFSAEESGLNGSNYYANNPIYPIEKHVMMMNFDMIGRIKDKRLSLSGASTGAGLVEFLEPLTAASPLEIIQPASMSGMSDHTSFQRKKMPVLFAIIADFHGDYHTPRDVSSLINRVDAVHAANLFYEIALAAAQRPEAFAYVDRRAASRQRREQGKKEAESAAVETSPRASARLVFGVRPKYDDEGEGLLVEGVTPGSPAAQAGVRKGDRLLSWNGREIADARAFGGLLRSAAAGDTVKIGLERKGKDVTVEVLLRSRGTGR